jgi:hypothetical protein
MAIDAGQYSLDPNAESWEIPSPAMTMFDFDYTDGREQLLRLYDKGTRKQWIGSDRIDWSQDVDPTNPTSSTRSSSRRGGTR